MMKRINEFIRFISVGSTATIIHYSIYLALDKIINYNIAYTLGYIISFVFNFIASTKFTFNAKPTINKGIRFMISHGINYLIQIIVLNIFMNIGINKVVAPIVVFIICIPINFILVRKALKSSVI